MQAYWQTDIMYLKGVGPKRAELLFAELGIRTYWDLLQHYPRRHVDRSQVRSIASLQEEGEAVSLIGHLEQLEIVQAGRKRLQATLADGSGRLQLSWFEGVRYLSQRYKLGDEVALFGKVSFYKGQPQLVHPEMEPLKDEEHGTLNTLKIVPIYPGTEKLKRAGLDSRGLRRLVYQLLLQAPDIPDPLPPLLVQGQQLSSRNEALRSLHFPPSPQALQLARDRLKFEELFLFEWVLAHRKQLREQQAQAVCFSEIGTYFNTYYTQHLPFELTGAQKRVLKEIRRDVGRPIQMNRLVQGDVGSGKTIVALMASLMALDNGYQVAVMAPTEILAEQHYRSFSQGLAPLGIRVGFLSGSVKAAERSVLLADLAAGHIQVLIGTHALIETGVRFRQLGLTVIDEQHKFGVEQRNQLWQKGAAPHVPHNLALTATPIPRTLAMTAYGDIEVSVIDELPPGRKPITTVLRNNQNRLRMLGFIHEQLAEGRQAYVVYPLVDESAKSDLLAAEQGYAFLQQYFKDYRVGLVHGRLPAGTKEEEMQKFKANRTQVLVSTTVIEVGVDVPNANLMVIENAERFGLSQLHQLRGRVGRGAAQSFCILMAGRWPLGKEARYRLNALCSTQDGFRIAELDLKQRGPGDFLGTRQSGLPTFRLADLTEDLPLLKQARKAAFDLQAQDPDLSQEAHQALASFLKTYIRQHQLDQLKF
ncbi:MAG: ATP-dependent DNA helicase RecG [Sphingobacteriia bacterium]